MNPSRWDTLENLIIVAGHAVFLGGESAEPADARNWHLLPYQVGEVGCYLAHIRAGVENAAADPRALLVFSGGQTRADAGPRSEALGYWTIARASGWWGRADVANRTAVEDFSRDSFENLLFGICRFFECVGAYPGRIAVVSWEFKRERFDRHRQAIGFPRERFEFIGPNNPPDLESARRGEAVTLVRFEEDPYGALLAGTDETRNGRVGDLSRKRQERNPFRRQPGFLDSNPALTGLLRHRGPELFNGPLPWNPDARRD